ncbi:hypothetical protein MTO96_024551 [Rhipicephalus appendiculatus]
MDAHTWRLPSRRRGETNKIADLCEQWAVWKGPMAMPREPTTMQELGGNALCEHSPRRSGFDSSGKVHSPPWMQGAFGKWCCIREYGTLSSSSATAFLLLVAAGVVGAVFALIILFTEWESQVLLRVPGLGRFRGLLLEVENQPVYVFRGVRFGHNTAGEKRFDRPAAWADSTQVVIDARLSKPGCVQKPLKEGGQRCGTKQRHDRGLLAPECVDAVHGGLGTRAAAGRSWFSSRRGISNWATTTSTTVAGSPLSARWFWWYLISGWVSSAFLNLSVPGAPGDVALDDQRLALEWVVSHIASFGGNASDVVLMGSAAGACESPLRRYYANTVRRMSQLLRCPVEDHLSQLSCLRKTSTSDLLRVTSAWDCQQGPSTARAPESAARVVGRRFFVGVVSDEGSHLADSLRRLPSRTPDLRWMASTFLGTVYSIKLSAELVDAYSSYVKTEGENAFGNGLWVSQLLGDVLYVCPLVRLALELAAEHRNIVWGFLFDHRASFAPPYDGTGAPRFSELDFVFGRVLDRLHRTCHFRRTAASQAAHSAVGRLRQDGFVAYSEAELVAFLHRRQGCPHAHHSAGPGGIMGLQEEQLLHCE